MKKLILLAALTLLSVGAYAQGTVNFANIGGGVPGTVNAPITNGATGLRFSGAEGTVQLFAGPAGTADLSSLVAVPGTAIFNTGAQAGYFTGGQRTINGFPGGTTVTLQVRAWVGAAPDWADRKSVV